MTLFELVRLGLSKKPCFLKIAKEKGFAFWPLAAASEISLFFPDWIQKIEKTHKVSLSVDKDSRKKLAADAAESGLGCRFLRSKLQSMLDGQMFDEPEAKEFSLSYE